MLVAPAALVAIVRAITGVAGGLLLRLVLAAFVLMGAVLRGARLAVRAMACAVLSLRTVGSAIGEVVRLAVVPNLAAVPLRIAGTPVGVRRIVCLLPGVRVARVLVMAAAFAGRALAVRMPRGVGVRVPRCVSMRVPRCISVSVPRGPGIPRG